MRDWCVYYLFTLLDCMFTIRRLKIINVSNALFLASLCKKNKKNANMRDECSSNSNPVAAGI